MYQEVEGKSRTFPTPDSALDLYLHTAVGVASAVAVSRPTNGVMIASVSFTGIVWDGGAFTTDDVVEPYDASRTITSKFEYGCSAAGLLGSDSSMDEQSLPLNMGSCCPE